MQKIEAREISVGEYRKALFCKKLFFRWKLLNDGFPYEVVVWITKFTNKYCISVNGLCVLTSYNRLETQRQFDFRIGNLKATIKSVAQGAYDLELFVEEVPFSQINRKAAMSQQVAPRPTHSDFNLFDTTIPSRNNNEFFASTAEDFKIKYFDTSEESDTTLHYPQPVPVQSYPPSHQNSNVTL